MKSCSPLRQTYKLTIIFKPDFQKVDQQTGDNWLIQGIKHHKGNKFQSLEIPCRISL